MSKDLFADLNPAQQEAVRHVEGPLLILAGPGSGKTRVVTHRIAHLLEQGVPAHQMLAMTFTNKAADEMRSRVQALAPGARVWMSTFHRFSARLLRQHASLVGLSENYTIFDTDDSQRALNRAIEFSGEELTHTTPSQIAHAISWAKSRLIGPEDYVAASGSPIGHLVQQIYPRYQRELLESNAVDFDDLLFHVAYLLRENPELRDRLDERYRYILVDEYQDTNPVQYAIVRALSVDWPNLAVTGDPDQAIYGWRGASIENILRFEQDYRNVRTVRLEQNYRSTKRILRVADALIVNNRRRKAKRLFTENGEGAPVRCVRYPSYQDEAEDIAARIAADLRAERRQASDFAVFFRTNALSRVLEQALRRHGVPYQMMNGVEFYQRREIKDVLAYLHVLNNPSNEIALLRIINNPPRKIGKRTIQRLSEYAESERIPLMEAARHSGTIEALPKRAAVAVARFVAIIDDLSQYVTQSLEELVNRVLVKTGYEDLLQISDSEEDMERLANVKELVSEAREFDEQHPEGATLDQFLERVALVNDTDDLEVGQERVSLMTLHAAKGLEFPVVFLMGLEEGILPHERSRENPNQLEEERRLLFVGITRAKQECHLTRADARLRRGTLLPAAGSSFLLELPKAEMEWVEPPYGGSRGAFSDMPRRPRPTRNARATAQVMTAAQLAADAKVSSASKETGGASASEFDPERFEQGTMVNHPEYGLGKVTAVSGAGPRRMATVQFFGPAGERRFRLIHSKLEPVASGDD